MFYTYMYVSIDTKYWHSVDNIIGILLFKMYVAPESH